MAGEYESGRGVIHGDVRVRDRDRVTLRVDVDDAGGAGLAATLACDWAGILLARFRSILAGVGCSGWLLQSEDVDGEWFAPSL